MDNRFLIAIILSLGLIFLYQELVLKHMYPPGQGAQHKAKVASGQAAGAKGVATAVPTPAAAAKAVTAAAPKGELVSTGTAAPRLIKVHTELYDAVLTSEGASITSLRLNRYRETVAANSPGFQMVPAKDGSRPPVLIVAVSGKTYDDRGTDYTTNAPATIDATGQGDTTVRFTATTTSGMKIVKTFTFLPTSYVLDVNAAVSGSTKPIKAVGLEMNRSLATEGYRDYTELQAYVKGKALTESEKSLKKGVHPLQGPIVYTGFGDRYFFSAYLLKNPADGTLQMDYSKKQAQARILFAGRSKFAASLYMGPKDLSILESVNPALAKAIDFGWSGIIALPFLRLLKVFHLVSSNWGVDIILLTIVFRVLFLPLSVRSQRSMMRMQRLQPQVQRLRERYRDDSERLNREMVDLYRRNHVNPLGGCLPTVVQLPIFIGLYEALLNAIELRHAPFIGWIRDLSAPDCLPLSFMPKLPLMDCRGLPVLVLLMGASTFLQQWMTPTSPDPNQQRMMMLMPIVFTVMFVNFPAGLTLYYFASNILGIIQQFFLNREFKQLAPVPNS